MSILNRIRRLVEEGQYYFTEHALQEADFDGLNIYDIESVLLTGKIRRTWSKNPRYEIIGETHDNKKVGIVCRITRSGKVRVITAYEDKEK